MASVDSWSDVETPCETPGPADEQSAFQEAIYESKMVKIYVGRSLQIFLMPEDLFHKHIHGYAREFKRRSYVGVEKNLGLADENPEIFATFIDWANGKKNISKVHAIGSPLHELTCFKLYMLASKLRIRPLIVETWQEIRDSLYSHRYKLSEEAVALAFQVTKGVKLEELRACLIFWAMGEFFLGGRLGKGSSWKKALRSNKTFDREVAIAIGYHILRTAEDCGLERCYVHQQKAQMKGVWKDVKMSDDNEVGGKAVLGNLRIWK